MGIGQKIRIARARRGINSQSELHRLTGLSRPYISLLENDEVAGARKVTDLEKVAAALGVTLSWLLDPDATEPDWGTNSTELTEGSPAA